MILIMWNIFFLTMVGVVTVLIRRIWRSKMFPQVITVFWVFFFCCALLPFTLVGKVGSYVVSMQPAPERLKGWDYEPMGHISYQEELQSDTTSLLTEYQKKQEILRWCVGIWLAGIFVCVTVRIMTSINLRKKIKKSIRQEWSDWKKIGIKPRKKVKVYITEDIGPMAYGIKPAIYIPENFLEEDILKSILFHELTHISRKHNLVLIFMDAVGSIYWFLPYMELIFRKCLREDLELRCDYEVLKKYHVSFKEYAMHCMAVNKHQMEVDDSFLLEKGYFKRRLQQILEYKKDRLKTALSLMVLAVIVLSSSVWIAHNYFIKDVNGLTKWDVEQAKKVVIEFLNANNRGDEAAVRKHMYDNASSINILAQGTYELYNLDYASDNLTYYYAYKYMERHDLEINKCIYLQGKLSGKVHSIELKDVIYGFYLVRESGEWKLYDWGQ